MKLTEEQILRIKQTLRTDNICSNCKADTEYSVLNSKFQLLSPYVNEGIIYKDEEQVSAFPAIAICCSRCGHISLFNAEFFNLGNTSNAWFASIDLLFLEVIVKNFSPINLNFGG